MIRVQPCARVRPCVPCVPAPPVVFLPETITGTVPVTVLPSSRGVPPSVPGGDASSPPAVWGNEKAWLLRESEVFHFETFSSAARPCHLSCRDPWRGRRIDRHNGRDSETPTRQRASRLSEPSENDSEKAPPYLKRSRKNTACVRERPTSRTTRQWALARDCVGRGPCGYGYREVHKKNNDEPPLHTAFTASDTHTGNFTLNM